MEIERESFMRQENVRAWPRGTPTSKGLRRKDRGNNNKENEGKRRRRRGRKRPAQAHYLRAARGPNLENRKTNRNVHRKKKFRDAVEIQPAPPFPLSFLRPHVHLSSYAQRSSEPRRCDWGASYKSEKHEKTIKNVMVFTEKAGMHAWHSRGPSSKAYPRRPVAFQDNTTPNVGHVTWRSCR